MGKILVALGLIFSFGQNAQAFIKMENNDIIEAIKISLQENDLDCINYYSNHNQKASSLRLKMFEKEEATITVQEGRQPVITAMRAGAQSRNVMHVMTNSDYSVVTQLKIQAYRLNGSRKVNYGTITKPEIVTVPNWYQFEDIVCQ